MANSERDRDYPILHDSLTNLSLFAFGGPNQLPRLNLQHQCKFLKRAQPEAWQIFALNALEIFVIDPGFLCQRFLSKTMGGS
jgi:hypothetical protein